jgi:hypothetical protein
MVRSQGGRLSTGCAMVARCSIRSYEHRESNHHDLESGLNNAPGSEKAALCVDDRGVVGTDGPVEMELGVACGHVSA